jgi:hypothetical protein
MPLLDVTELLTDPDFMDLFDVIRRLEVPGANGVMTTQDTTYKGVGGVVTASTPSDLERAEDYQTMTRSISVVTKFQLQGEVTGYQPDIVVWRGTYHIVKHVAPYPHFGAGFVEVECSSLRNTDPRP